MGIAEQPVWMGSAGKIALLYALRFWDPAQLSIGLPTDWLDGPGFGGVQTYDAGMTTDGRDLHAIVAFVMGKGIDIDKEALAKVLAEQLHLSTKLPRDKLMGYEAIEFKFWKADELVQTEIGTKDLFPSHPEPIRNVNRDVTGRSIWFINSEASPNSPGYLEGAIENSEKMATLVLRKLKAM